MSRSGVVPPALLLRFRSFSYFPVDVSGEIYEAWGKPLERVPAFEDLKEVLGQPLEAALPWIAAGARRSDCDVIARRTGCVVDGHLLGLAVAIAVLKRVGTSEDSLHSVVDPLVMRTLDALASFEGLGLAMDRNTMDKSGKTKGTSRPDFLCWLPSGVLVFKGGKGPKEGLPRGKE